MMLIERIQTTAMAQPDAIAIACAGESVLDYHALWQQASAIADALRVAGQGRGAVIALHLEKSPEFVVAMLGAWIAGAAWVPVLPELPEARRRLIVDETRARAVIVGSDRVPSWFADHVVIDARQVSPAREHAIGCAPGDLAYVIYTSGSTGQPKGVCVPQRGLVPLVDAQIAAFDLKPRDRCLWLLSPGFDASVSDVCTALVAGATLHIEHPARLRSASGLLEVIRQRGITHCDLPPSLLPLLDPAVCPPSLRTLVIGGEVAAPAAVRAWASRVRVVNVYGPTEATVCSTLGVCGPDWQRPLIGQPIAGTALAIVDASGESLEGELWIGGAGIADGYLDRPELTAAKFVERDGARWFRTGDRVRRHADGEIEFLGRIDRQLKLHGILIAPEEIEARLRDHPAVSDAAVVLERRGEREQLVAYVALRDNYEHASVLGVRTLVRRSLERGPVIDTGEWRAHLAQSLDPRAIPHRFTVLDAIPRTASGKLDLDRLTTESQSATTSRSTESSAIETQLATIWARLLGTTPARDDDFFELGGDSLAVIEHVGLAELAGLAMTAELIYAQPTLAGLARAIEDASFETSATCASLIADVALVAAAAASPQPAGDLLLTGATGFLGAHVLADLLADGARSITCLVRGGPERLGLALAKIGREVSLDRVTCVSGDLALPRFGLDDRRWKALAARTEAIVHGAAEVSLARPYRALRPANVDGTARVLELASLANARVHHASTLSVFVGSDRAPGVLRETDALETAERLHGGYAQSKWAAEYLAREAGATIYRFGLLTGDTETGRAPDRDWLTWFLRGLARVGAYPAPDRARRVDLTPIDHASRAFAALISARATGTFHIANSRSATLAELVAAIERAGIALRAVDSEEWSAVVGAHTSSSDLHELAAALLGARRLDRNRACDVFQATGMTIDTARTTAVAGACPPPSTALLDRYVRRALEGR
jgi:amino acid adenylation domain-containing protein/thioester reductase-like protein